MTNALYYGDNLSILREYIADESVNLVYLDPPFNSNRTYNVLFKSEAGLESEAQISAFEDTWHWTYHTEQLYNELVTGLWPEVGDMIAALRGFIGENQMMAYLVMMAARLVELHRVLKPTGSLYLHCDPTASHYLKIVLDTIFNVENFRNEIIWKRSASHGGATSYHNIHDVILYYSQKSNPVWNSPRLLHSPSYIESHYNNMDDDGRRYQLVSAHGAGRGPSRKFGDRTIDPPPGRHWMSQEHIDQMMADDKVVFTKTGRPRYKRYLDETDGRPMGTIWDDIPPLNSQAAERLGYPTQKPVALLKRIIEASSNEGDVVLDPFCGCGTTIAAAQELNRQWIGIDITHLSIALQKYRLRDTFGLVAGADYEVIGEPVSVASARQLAQDDPFQFQFWALSLIQARPYGAKGKSKKGKKGADQGIDGLINFIDDNSKKPKRVIVQVKGGKVSSPHIRDLVGTVQREEAALGVYISMEKPTGPMIKEAATAGVYHSPGWQQDYPKIQLFTIEELVSGASVDMPPITATFKQAGKVKPEGNQPSLGLE